MPTGFYNQFHVASDSSPGKFYVVSQNEDGWQCSCIGWTRHVPRKDCKHIRWAKMGGAFPIDPLLHAMEIARKKAGVDK